jgi:tetratricopeptide (TPR) repeat protein
MADDPQYTQAFLNLGVIYRDEGKLYEAAAEFQKAIDISPDLAAAYTGLAEVRAMEGHLDRAVPLFQKAATLEPDSATAHINLGVALADSWDVDAALSEFSRAEQIDPKSADAHYHEGRVLAKLDRLDEARKELELTCALEPNSPSAAYTLALIVRQQRDLDLSTRLLQKVIELSPNYPRAQSALAHNLSEAGKPAEAVQHWRLALRIDPSDTDALYGLGHALAKSNPTEAKLYIDRLNDLQKSEQLVDRIETLGNVGIKAAGSQEWAKAISAYEEALELCGECQLSEALHKNLGLIYGHKGDTDKAELELREALKLNPQDPDVIQAMNALNRTAH